jgi:hypothetical protein
MRAIGVLVALTVIAGAAWADTDPTNKKLADQKFIEGRDRMKANDFKGACEKFHEAQKFDERNVAILLNLGLCYEKQDKVATALKWYRKTQTVSSELRDPNFKEYEDAAKESTGRLTSEVARITLILNDLQENASITIDGVPVERTELTVEVDAGAHMVEAKAAGKQPSRTEITVKNKEVKTHPFKKLADVIIGPAPDRTKRRIVGAVIGLGGFGVASLTFGLLANNTQNKYEEELGKDPATEKPTGKMRTLGVIWGGISAVALGVGGYLFFSSPKESNRTAWAPVITPDQIGVAFSGGF